MSASRRKATTGATGRRVDWETRWEEFIRSYEQHLVETEYLRADLLAGLARRPEYRAALLPPEGYLYAWRLLHDVQEEALRRLLGRKPPPSCVVRQARYVPLSLREACSWTLDPSIFAEGRMPFLDVAQDVPRVGTYVVVIRAPLAQRVRRFWLNPDLLYDIADARNLRGEREVVSVGRVDGCSIAWEEGHAPEDYDPDEADDYDAERMLIPEIADRCVSAIESGDAGDPLR